MVVTYVLLGVLIAAQVLVSSPEHVRAEGPNQPPLRVDAAAHVHPAGGGGVDAAGAVNVLYGLAGGLDDPGNQFWSQLVLYIPGIPEEEDAFGRALATGDFNADGWADLAVGVPGDRIGGKQRAGAVHLLYGSDGGLKLMGNQYWHQDRDGIPDTAETGDLFGSALAAGDFNGDSYADLAVGLSGENVGGVTGAGAVNVIYGSLDGLTASGSQLWHQDSQDVLGTGEIDDWFGAALTAGDFDGDGCEDLAVGVPGEDVLYFLGQTRVQAGAVSILYGSTNGLTAIDNQVWTQLSLGGAPWSDEYFGSSLAAGDFDGDGYADLAVGAPEEDVGSAEDAGTVSVLYGSNGGLTDTDSQYWHENSSGIQDEAETDDAFGAALAAGDFNGDGCDDLAIGVPMEEIVLASEGGVVSVLYSQGTPGLAAGGNQRFAIGNEVWLPGYRDHFGEALAAGDFDGDGYADLAVGAPGAQMGGLQDSGVVQVVDGGPVGLIEASKQHWDQDSEGILNAAEKYDAFGRALAAGDFDGDGYADLAVGVAENPESVYLPLVARQSP